MKGLRGRQDMEGESDKYALDIDEGVTEPKYCGIPVEQALINCGTGSKLGLRQLGPGLGKLCLCVSVQVYETVICTSQTVNTVHKP